MLIIVKRGSGDRPTPQDIVDPLCCTNSVAVARGTSFLDSQEASDEVVLSLPLTGLPPTIGSMASVLTIEKTIEEMRITGWSLQVSVSDDMVDQQLSVSLQKRNPLI
jgi:hypothetical protein